MTTPSFKFNPVPIGIAPFIGASKEDHDKYCADNTKYVARLNELWRRNHELINRTSIVLKHPEMAAIRDSAFSDDLRSLLLLQYRINEVHRPEMYWLGVDRESVLKLVDQLITYYRIVAM